MIVFYYNIGPSFIGHVSIQQQADYQYTVIWDFSDLNDYNYDDSLVEVDSSGGKLKQTNTTNEWQEEIIASYSVQQALYNQNDKTDKIEAVDIKKLQVNKDDIFDVFFNGSIDNGYIISLYLEDSDASDIYLCDLSEQCDSPGYGLVSFNGNEGWYNITVSGLNNAVAGFNIDPVNVKFDYVTAMNIEYITHTEENISYPLSAEIETDDHIIENLKSFDTFSYEHELNSNSIVYYYSVDSGESWNLIDANLSSVDATNNKIRFKAILYSDQTSTPVLEEMRLGYTVLCMEEWNMQYSECSTDDAKIKFYTDANVCGTTANLPEDNGNYVECDYCTPSWSCNGYEDCQTDDSQQCNSVSDDNGCYAQTALESDIYNGDYSEFETQLCDYCAPDWTAVNTSCQITDELTEYYADSNNCFTGTSLESDNNPPANNTRECDYCVPEWQCNGYGACLQNNTKTCLDLVDSNNCYNITGIESDLAGYENYTISCVYNNTAPLLINTSLNLTKTVINNTDSETIIEINSVEAINDTISVVEYSANPVNVTVEKKSAGKYVEIVEENTSSNLSSVIIKVYYNETEINNLNIDENSLKLYYFNESSLEWQELESFVDSDENYVYVNLTHLSLFGIYGDEIQNQSTIIEEDINDESEESPSTDSAGKKESSTEKKIISEPAQDFEEAEEEEKEVTLKDEKTADEPLPVLKKSKAFTQTKKVDDKVIGLVIIAVFAIIMIFVSTKKKKINKQAR